MRVYTHARTLPCCQQINDNPLTYRRDHAAVSSIQAIRKATWSNSGWPDHDFFSSWPVARRENLKTKKWGLNVSPFSFCSLLSIRNILKTKTVRRIKCPACAAIALPWHGFSCVLLGALLRPEILSACSKAHSAPGHQEFCKQN